MKGTPFQGQSCPASPASSDGDTFNSSLAAELHLGHFCKGSQHLLLDLIIIRIEIVIFLTRSPSGSSCLPSFSALPLAEKLKLEDEMSVWTFSPYFSALEISVWTCLKPHQKKAAECIQIREHQSDYFVLQFASIFACKRTLMQLSSCLPRIRCKFSRYLFVCLVAIKHC